MEEVKDVSRSNIEMNGEERPGADPTQSACCFCNKCCCGIRLLTAVKIIALYGIALWSALTINMIISLSYAGGSDWMPGSKAKYVSIAHFLGFSVEALGAIAAICSSYSKQLVGARYVYLKVVSIFVVHIANVILLIMKPKVLEVDGSDYATMVAGIVVWALVDLYFILILRSYGLKPTHVHRDIDLRASRDMPVIIQYGQQQTYPTFTAQQMVTQIPTGVPVMPPVQQQYPPAAAVYPQMQYQNGGTQIMRPISAVRPGKAEACENAAVFKRKG